MRIPNNPQQIEKMDSLESMVRENLKQTQEIMKAVKKINRYIFWQKFWGWTKFFIILIPIILAVIYLPNYIKKGYEIYQSVLSPLKSGGGGASLENIENLIKQLQGLSGQINQGAGFLEQIKNIDLDKINLDQLKK